MNKNRIVATLVLTVLSVTAVLSILLIGKVRANSGSYPGELSSGKARVVVSSLAVEFGLHAYYKVYGTWPQSWQAVVDAGLWQTEIPSRDGSRVDPDDPTIDFFDDVYYSASQSFGSDGKARIMVGGNPGSQPIRTILLDPPKTFDSYFTEVDGHVGSNLSSSYTSDLEMKRLFAILGEVSSLCGIYYTVHQQWPQSLDSFLSSGLSPVNKDSINPVTGQRFRFDGSSGDCIVTFSEAGPQLSHTERSGSAPTYKISYY